MRDFYRIELSTLDDFDATVARFDREGLLTYLNRTGEKLFGATVDDTITLRSLFRDENEFQRILKQQANRLAGKASTYETYFTPPGYPETTVPISIYAFPDSDESGAILGSIALVHDLREGLARSRIHHAIEAAPNNTKLLTELAAALKEFIPFHVLRITAISRSRQHIRTLFSTDPNHSELYPLRWWPMPPEMRNVLSQTMPQLRTNQELRSEYKEFLHTEPHLQRYLDSGMQQVLWIPILQRGEVVAFFAMDSMKDGLFNEHTIALLRRLPIPEAVNTALNREDTQRHHAIFQMLRTLGSMARDVQAVCKALVSQLSNTFGWERVGVYRMYAGDVTLNLVEQHVLPVSKPIPPMDTLVSEPDPRLQLFRLEGNEKVFTLHLGDDADDGNGLTSRLKQAGMHSLLAVFMPGQTVQWLLNVESTKHNAFSFEEKETLEILAAEVTSILYNSTLFEMQKAILNTISDVVMETNEKGRIRWVNPAGRRLLKIQPNVKEAEMHISDFLPEDICREALAYEGTTTPLETELKQQHGGGSLAVLLSIARLPLPLSGHVFIASDFSVHKELQRLHDLKEVFKHAAMEGRVPLALASSWLHQFTQSKTLRRDAERVLRQLARADLPLERLMRMFASEEYGSTQQASCDFNGALHTTVCELPDELAKGLEINVPDMQLPVKAEFDDVQFCIESLVSFGLRTKPQSQLLKLELSVDDDAVTLVLDGDWRVEAANEAAHQSPNLRWKRKSMSDLALGQSVIDRIACRAGGSLHIEFSPRLHFELCLPRYS